MNRSLEELTHAKESNCFTKIIPHERLVAELDFSDTQKRITLDKTITVCYSQQKLEENAVIYLATLNCELQKYKHSLLSEHTEAQGRLHKFEERNNTIGFNSHFLTQLYYKIASAQRVKRNFITTYEQKVLDYQLLKDTFSDGVMFLQGMPSAKKEVFSEGTKNDIIMATETSSDIAKRYWLLEGLARKQRAAQERWYYHYFDDEQ